MMKVSSPLSGSLKSVLQSRRGLLAGFYLWVVLGSLHAHASVGGSAECQVASEVPPASLTAGQAALTLETNAAGLQIEPTTSVAAQAAQACAQVKVRLAPGHTLLFGAKPRAAAPGAGSVTIGVAWKTPDQAVRLTWVTPRGEIQAATLRLEGIPPTLAAPSTPPKVEVAAAVAASEATVPVSEVLPPVPARRFGVGLDYTDAFMSYTRAGPVGSGGTFQEARLSLLTVGVDYRQPLSEGSRWTLQGSGYMTLASLSVSTKSMQGTSFLGVNARALYQLLPQPQAFSVLLGGGYYYATMSLSQAGFGYQNMHGPQVSAVASRVLGNWGTAGLNFKLALVSPTFGLMSFASREVAVGAFYRPRRLLDERLGFALNLANIRVEQGTHLITNSTRSFGLNYRFDY